jgi:hypothetical protein
MTEKTCTGGCLCGAVRFEVVPAAHAFTICHCGMCRKWSGGLLSAVHCARAATFAKDEGLVWYRSSDWGERGFCGRCGTNLFWRLADDHDVLAVSLEALDDADDFPLERHIFVDHTAARYAFADDRPRVTEAEFMAEWKAKQGG